MEKVINQTVNKISKTATQIKKGVKKIVNKKVNLLSKIIFNNSPGFPPQVAKLIKINGNSPIVKMTLCRSVVPTAIRKLMFKLSNSNQERILYHLYVLIKLENGVTLNVQKNERIDVSTKFPKPAQTMEVDQDMIGLNLNRLFAGAKYALGNDKFYSYNASSNNCQNFIQAIMRAGKLLTPERNDFIKQDTSDIFIKNAFLRKMANSVVKLSARASIAMNGGELLMIKPKRALSEWQKFYMAYARENNISMKQAMSDASESYKAQK